MSPCFVLGRENVPCVAEVVNRSLKADCTDFTSTYVYAGGLSVLGLAISGYLLYNTFKKQERNLIDVPPPPVVKTNTELKRDIFEMF